MHIVKDQELENRLNIIGKTMVVFEKVDLSEGDAGSRLCCGVIEELQVDATGDEKTEGEGGAAEGGATDETKEETPAEDPNRYEIELLKSGSPAIVDLAKQFTNISQACNGKNCVYDENLGFRALTFEHQIDGETSEMKFCALSQKYEAGSPCIHITDYT